MSDTMKGVSHPQTEETRNKIRNTQTGKPHPHKGRKWSNASKEKLSKSMKGKSTHNKGCKCKIIDGKRTYYKEEVQYEKEEN